MIDLTATLHHADSGFEIHKMVVGPIDNNVFVLRCTETVSYTHLTLPTICSV